MPVAHVQSGGMILHQMQGDNKLSILLNDVYAGD